MLRLKDLISNNTLNQPMAELLTNSVCSGVSVLITGSPGSGKTTLMQSLIPYMVGRSILAHATYSNSDYPADDKRFHFCERIDLDSAPAQGKPVEMVLSKHGDYVLVEDAYSLVDESALRENGLIGSLNTLAPLASLMNNVGVMSIVDLSVDGYIIEAFSENTIDKMPGVCKPYLVITIDALNEEASSAKHRITSIHEAIYGASGYEEIYDGIYKPTGHTTVLNKIFDYDADTDSHNMVGLPSESLELLIRK